MFLRHPLVLALSPQLPEVGDYVTHVALNTNLLLVRDQHGAPRAYINACRHRGAKLPEGCGNKPSIVCPFHAWTWDLDGKTQNRPNSANGFTGIGAKFDQLHEVPCFEVAGLVFVSLEGDDIKTKVHALVGDALPDIANFNITDTQYIDNRNIELEYNYKFFSRWFYRDLSHTNTPYEEYQSLLLCRVDIS